MKQSKLAGDVTALIGEHVPGVRVHRVHIIEVTEPETCDLCGKLEECRPYGPNGENICFECGMLDKEATDRAIKKRFTGENGA